MRFVSVGDLSEINIASFIKISRISFHAMLSPKVNFKKRHVLVKETRAIASLFYIIGE